MALVRVELSGHRTTSDSGALLLREALDSSGMIEALDDNLVDLRNPLRIRHIAGQPASYLGASACHGLDRPQRYRHAAS